MKHVWSNTCRVTYSGPIGQQSLACKSMANGTKVIAKIGGILLARETSVAAAH
jgi:hypothetical protein